jgi:hypothetical protein
MKMIIRTIATLIMAVLICSFEISAFADSESATQEHYKKQFEIIMNYESFWSTKDDTEQYWYTVTDLDHNGCLEIVSAVNYSTGNLTHIEAYEVSTSTQSTKRLWLWSPIFSMIGKEFDLLSGVIDSHYPDIAPYGTNTTVLPAFHNDETGEWVYCYWNINSAGREEIEEIVESISVYEGTLVIRPIVQKYTVDLGAKVSYYGEQGKTITESEYLNWEERFSDYDRYDCEFRWFSLYKGLTLEMLEDSFSTFMLSL